MRGAIEEANATTAGCVPTPDSPVVPTPEQLDAIEEGPEGCPGEGAGDA